MVGRGVFFTGYPEEDRRVLHPKAVEFLQASNGLVASNVEPDEIEVVIDPAYLNNLDGRPPPPTTKNLSGNSCAPLLVVSAACPGPVFWLGGIVIRQLKVQSGGKPTIVWTRRPNCILPSGRLRKSRYVLDDEPETSPLT